MPPILLILIVPLIGLIAGVFALSSGTLQIGGLLWIVIPLIVLFLLGSFLSRLSSTPAQPNQLIHPQRDTPLESGHSEYVDKNTRILHADGYAFELTNRFNGRIFWREVDPTSKQPLERWITSHERHAAYLGEDRIVREHITTRINQRKGL